MVIENPLPCDKTRTATAGITLLLLTLSLAGCNMDSAEFALPPGDADSGRATFVLLGCNYCHRIEGTVELIDPHVEWSVELGGQVTRVKSYADLVTSVINPSHKRSTRHHSATSPDSPDESPMPVYNDIMTVQELVDIVTFLQGTYTVAVPTYHPYIYAP